MTRQDRAAFNEWYIQQRYLAAVSYQVADDAWQAALAYARAEQADREKRLREENERLKPQPICDRCMGRIDRPHTCGA